jgi:hypothetical protein
VGGALAGKTSYFGLNATHAFRQNNAFFAILLLSFHLLNVEVEWPSLLSIQMAPKLALRFFVAFLSPSR